MNNDLNKNIDDFYKEEILSYDKFEIDNAYTNSLGSMKEYMDGIKEIDYLDLSLETVINEAFEKRTVKINKKENIYFLVLSSIVMILIITIAMSISINFIIYLQIFMILIMPFIIIPVALIEARGNNI